MTNEGISSLRRRMIEDMSVRNLSPTTRASYIHNVKKFSQHFGRSPDCLGLGEVRAYQVHLVSQGIAWATLNQVVSSLRFFYGVTRGRAVFVGRFPRELGAIFGNHDNNIVSIVEAGQVMFFLRLLAGKLHESRRMLDNLVSKDKEFKDRHRLDRDGPAAEPLKRVFKHFDKWGNLLGTSGITPSIHPIRTGL